MKIELIDEQVNLNLNVFLTLEEAKLLKNYMQNPFCELSEEPLHEKKLREDIFNSLKDILSKIPY